MPPKSDGRLFRARTNFATTFNGVPTVVAPGDLAREGHPILQGRLALFEPFEPKVRFEQATAAPGEKRGT